jgi:hypothetical protein
VSQLAPLGLRPDDLAYVANSHFHFDHCGGNECFPRATFLVQKREMEAARAAAGSYAGYTPSARDFDHPLDYRLIDGEHDVSDDGTVVLVPTFGHTPGHQSLRIRGHGPGGPVSHRGRVLHAREHGPRSPSGVLWDAPECRARSRCCATSRPEGRRPRVRPRPRAMAGPAARPRRSREPHGDARMKIGFHLTPFWSPTDRGPTRILDEAIQVVAAASRMGYAWVSIGQHWVSHPTVWPQPLPVLARLAPETGAMRLKTSVPCCRS